MRHLCIGLVGLYIGLIHLSIAGAAEWSPAPGPLMTRWAADVRPDSVWPEYPRPQMVRSEWQNLNGLWDYAITARGASKPESWQGQILVPFAVESALSGVKRSVQPDQRLWYRKTFTAPALPDGGRLLLHFGAVDWEAQVWLNGHELGTHRGGYDPFTFDVTDAIVSGSNELVVAVWDPTNQGFQPRGKQVLQPRGIMYTAVTGIWQTVWLEPVPRQHIRSLVIVPDVDRRRVLVTVNTSAPGRVHVTALDGEREVGSGSAPAGQVAEVVIPSPKLWSPDSPHLYDLQIALSNGEREVDRVNSYCGMRKIEVRRDADGVNRLMLNGQFVFQFGPLDQGWWPDGLYTPASDEALKYDIVMTKKFGMNMARKHVKYEPARWYYWCDRLGLLVWQDMPSGDAKRNDESKANFRRELKAMIDALRNFPSIIMWVPFNEGWGQFDTPEIVAWIKEYDPSRLVNEASGWTDRGSGDVSDMHRYPGPGMRPLEPNRACVLGEFGGLGMPVAGHTWQDEKNWGYVSYDSREALTDAYVDLLAQLRPLIGQGLCAAVYTQTSDVEIEVNGLMTYDRALVKMDLNRIAEAAHKLYLPPPIVRTIVPTSQSEAQTWRYTFEPPDAKWFTNDFDDAGWSSGPGGFGTQGTPGAVVGTVWNSPDIWIRRTFELEEIPGDGQLSLMIHHDEDADVYLNGQLVKQLKRFTTSYHMVPLSESAVRLLEKGQNTLAVHCHQTTGGQFIDAGLVMVVERDE